jgi:photosystem II stability/assembly factor-like uncharacterized protein
MGETWISLYPTLNAQMVSILVRDSSGNIYANTDNGLFKYNNTEWIKIYNASVKSIAIHPNGEVFIGIGVNTGMLKSVDGGANWITCNVATGTIEILCWSFAENGDIYVGTSGMPVMGQDYFMSSIYKSSDLGESWKKIASLKGVEISAVATNSQGTVLAGTGWGLFRSQEPFTHWEEIDIEYGFPLTMTIDKNDDFIAIFANYYSYASTDKGESWDLMANENLRGIRGGIQKNVDGHFYTACYGKGIMLYNNETKKWVTIGNNISRLVVLSICTDENVIIVGTDKFGIYSSNDGGQSWIGSKTNFEPYISRIYAAPSGRYYTSAYYTSGISNSNCYYSDDKGINWDTLKFFENIKVHDFIELNSGRVLISSVDGLFHSEDGASWTQVADGLESISISCFTLGDANVIFVGTINNGLLKSTNNGETWVTSNTSVIDSLNIRSIASDTEGTVIAGPLFGGIYVSNDNGNTWQKTTNGYDGKFPMVIDFDKDGNAFILDFYKGVFKSTDKGNSWENFRPSVGTSEAVMTGALYNNGSTFLASLPYQGGLFFTELQATSISELQSMNSLIFPNPATDYIEISYTNGLGVNNSPTNKGVNIYNTLGECVLTTPYPSTGSGSENLRIDISHLTRGVYFVKIGERVQIFVKE